MIVAKVAKQGKFVDLTMEETDGLIFHVYRFDAEEEFKAKMIALNINKALAVSLGDEMAQED